MIFGVVTAEIAKEFSESLRCHDRRKVFENVVSRSGVTLFMSDDKKDIRLQGLWESVKDAYDILEGEYGSYVGLPAKSPSNDGRGRKPQQSRASKISSLAASKTWCSPPSSTEKEKTTPLPKGSVRSAGYRGKSAWKLMKNWPKAPDPVIIFEGVTPGVSSSADLLSKGNKDEIRKAIEDITSKQQQKYDPELSAHAQPTFDSEQHVEPEMSDVGNLLPDFHSEQVNQNAAPPAVQYDRTEVEERATVIETVNDRNGEVDEEDPHEDAADPIEDSDDDDMQNKGETSVPDNIDSDKPHDDSSPVKEDTDVKEEVEAEPEPKPEKVKTGPQTRGNKRKAGRPRKIPIKTVSSGDDGILDDSDSDYKAPPKKSRRKRRAPMRKSQRRRAPVRRQGVVATPDEPVVKRKRGRPRKSEKEVLKCADCDFIAKNKIQLRTHKQRLHVGSETGSCRCPVCDKQFSFEKDMKRHMMRHVDTRYPCDICGRVYKDRKTMLTHKERHKEGWVQPTFSCDQCNKKFCTKYILTNHIKSEHLGLKRLFLCPTCGKSFTQKHAYLQHANVHLGIKPFVCDICSKAFAYEKSLKEHKFMHFDEKTFVCQVCSKAFRQKSALVVHAKIHKTTKDFLCSVCSKGFTQKQALLRHERVHNGEKPFACGVCGRTFSDKSIIRRHMILVHKRDSKQWKENTFEEKKERSDYFVTPKLHCDLVEEPPATTDSATVTQQMPKTILTPLAPQTTPAIPPPMLSLEQREVNHPTPPEPVPISPAPPVPPRMPSVPLSMVPQTQLPPIATHTEENLHPAHTGMPPISHGGPLFNPRDMHELRDIRDMRDMRDMQDMRDIRTPDMRTVDLHVRDLRNAEMRELQPADMRDMRTSDVRDMRVLGPRDHPKMSSLTDLRDVRVPDMRDMRLPDMRDLRPPSHNDLRDLRDLRDLGRDGHLSVPPLPAPGHEPAAVTTHSVAEMSPGSLTSSVSYSTSIPPGISSHHGAYPSTVSSPSPMPVHHYPYMYSNIPQNYDPHSGSPYVQQPQMNYYQ